MNDLLTIAETSKLLGLNRKDLHNLQRKNILNPVLIDNEEESFVKKLRRYRTQEVFEIQTRIYL
jgi:hypothetical protein